MYIDAVRTSNQPSGRDTIAPEIVANDVVPAAPLNGPARTRWGRSSSLQDRSVLGVERTIPEPVRAFTGTKVLHSSPYTQLCWFGRRTLVGGYQKVTNQGTILLTTFTCSPTAPSSCAGFVMSARLSWMQRQFVSALAYW
jgi:hypothetical protein